LRELQAALRAIQDDLDHALWIGGPARSGKTTVARALARRHGLRLYSADTRTWEHRDRALAAGHPGAMRWEALTIEERQRIVPDEIFELWIHWERGPMLVDDVRALPDAPMVVVEGTTVPADRSPALWLSRPSAWPDSPVFRRFAEEILERGERHGVPLLLNEGPLDETIAAVEQHFADALALGPRAQGLEERRALLREANEAIVRQVRGYFARPWAEGDGEAMVRDFICECDDPECRAVLEVSIAEFVRGSASGPLTAPGHDLVT
jgi:hypothetical protein